MEVEFVTDPATPAGREKTVAGRASARVRDVRGAASGGRRGSWPTFTQDAAPIVLPVPGSVASADGVMPRPTARLPT